MTREECLREVLVFLDAARSRFPFGIPKHVPVSTRGTLKAVRFLAVEIDAAGRAMLEAAVTQGMKLPFDQAVLNACNPASLTPESIEQLLGADQARVTVCLGAEFSAPELLPRMERVCSKLIVTEGISDILQKPAAKKKFWQDLKKALSHLGEA